MGPMNGFRYEPRSPENVGERIHRDIAFGEVAAAVALNTPGLPFSSRGDNLMAVDAVKVPLKKRVAQWSGLLDEAYGINYGKAGVTEEISCDAAVCRSSDLSSGGSSRGSLARVAE